VSGSVFTNRAILKVAAALPHIPASEIAELITGASGHFYKNLSDGDREEVVAQIMGAISESFYYLVAITAVGFLTSLLLSVSIVPSPSPTRSDTWLT
jgi:hypothetical protein